MPSDVEDVIPLPRGDFVDGYGRGKIIRVRKSERPEGAVRLGPREVASYHKERIHSWQPQSDV